MNTRLLRRHFSQRARSFSRRGFTLLETILALSLAGILLAGMYAAIDQTWKLTASGRMEMERVQLARSLIHRIELDIRSITYQPPPPVEDTTSTTSSSTTSSSSSGGSSGGGSGSNSGGNSSGGGSNSGGGGNSGGGSSGGGSSGGGSSGGSNSGGGSGGSSSGGSGGSSSSSSSDTTTTEPTTPNSKPIGIRGTAIQMEMSIIRPRRDLLPGSGQNLIMSGTSDLREVTYSFVGTGSALSGLIRSEGDRMAVEMVEANGGMATQISSAQMMAPEVANVMFRYFDGTMWQTTWDSDTVGRLPRAVEISVAFAPIQVKRSMFTPPLNHSADMFRTVILIPVSDPFPKEFVQ